MEERLYFAYGSNIDLHQMSYRCPNATVVETAVLENYELLFRGNRTGFGVATIRPKEGGQVHGLIWKLTLDCERSLDVYEGYPGFYEKQTVSVKTKDGRQLQVMVYVMTQERTRAPAPPSPAYYGGIWDGYRQNGLPVKELQKALVNCWREADELEFQPMKSPQKPKKKEKNSYER